jgi:hypothetical protein
VAIPLEFDSSRYYGSTQLINHPTSGRHNEWLVARKRPGMTGQLWRSTNGLSSTASDWTKLGGSTFDGDNKPITVYIHKNFPNQIWVGTTDVSSATTAASVDSMFQLITAKLHQGVAGFGDRRNGPELGT